MRVIRADSYGVSPCTFVQDVTLAKLMSAAAGIRGGGRGGRLRGGGVAVRPRARGGASGRVKAIIINSSAKPTSSSRPQAARVDAENGDKGHARQPENCPACRASDAALPLSWQLP